MTTISREIDIETAIDDAMNLARIAMHLYEDIDEQRRNWSESKDFKITPKQMEDNLRPLNDSLAFAVYQLVMTTRQVRDAYQEECKAHDAARAA